MFRQKLPGAHPEHADELVVEVPEETAAEVKRLVSETMKEAMGKFVRTVPIEVKAQIRDFWAES